MIPRPLPLLPSIPAARPGPAISTASSSRRSAPTPLRPLSVLLLCGLGCWPAACGAGGGGSSSPVSPQPALSAEESKGVASVVLLEVLRGTTAMHEVARKLLDGAPANSTLLANVAARIGMADTRAARERFLNYVNIGPVGPAEESDFYREFVYELAREIAESPGTSAERGNLLAVLKDLGAANAASTLQDAVHAESAFVDVLLPAGRFGPLGANLLQTSLGSQKGLFDYEAGQIAQRVQALNATTHGYVAGSATLQDVAARREELFAVTAASQLLLARTDQGEVATRLLSTTSNVAIAATSFALFTPQLPSNGQGALTHIAAFDFGDIGDWASDGVDWAGDAIEDGMDLLAQGTDAIGSALQDVVDFCQDNPYACNCLYKLIVQEELCDLSAIPGFANYNQLSQSLGDVMDFAGSQLEEQLLGLGSDLETLAGSVTGMQEQVGLLGDQLRQSTEQILSALGQLSANLDHTREEILAAIASAHAEISAVRSDIQDLRDIILWYFAGEEQDHMEQVRLPFETYAEVALDAVHRGDAAAAASALAAMRPTLEAEPRHTFLRSGPVQTWLQALQLLVSTHWTRETVGQHYIGTLGPIGHLAGMNSSAVALVNPGATGLLANRILRVLSEGRELLGSALNEHLLYVHQVLQQARDDANLSVSLTLEGLTPLCVQTAGTAAEQFAALCSAAWSSAGLSLPSTTDPTLNVWIQTGEWIDAQGRLQVPLQPVGTPILVPTSETTFVGWAYRTPAGVFLAVDGTDPFRLAAKLGLISFQPQTGGTFRASIEVPNALKSHSSVLSDLDGDQLVKLKAYPNTAGGPGEGYLHITQFLGGAGADLYWLQDKCAALLEALTPVLVQHALIPRINEAGSLSGLQTLAGQVATVQWTLGLAASFAHADPELSANLSSLLRSPLFTGSRLFGHVHHTSQDIVADFKQAFIDHVLECSSPDSVLPADVRSIADLVAIAPSVLGGIRDLIDATVLPRLTSGQYFFADIDEAEGWAASLMR